MMFDPQPFSAIVDHGTGHTWMVVHGETEEGLDDLMDVVAKWVKDDDLPFTWYQAACLIQHIRVKMDHICEVCEGCWAYPCECEVDINSLPELSAEEQEAIDGIQLECQVCGVFPCECGAEDYFQYGGE